MLLFFDIQTGREIGETFLKLFESKGVKFKNNCTVTEFHQEGGKVSAVTLKSEEKIPADICVIGAGVIPSTGFVDDSDLEKGRDKSIIVDEYMCSVSDDSVFAIGDLARFSDWRLKTNIRVEHYGMAQHQGRIAALNMIKPKSEKIKNVPFFWTTLFGKSIRYCGHALEFDEVKVVGDIKDLKFAAYFIKGDFVPAVCAVGKDPLVSLCAELMVSGEFPSVSELKKSDFKLVEDMLTK